MFLFNVPPISFFQQLLDNTSIVAFLDVSPEASLWINDVNFISLS